MKRSYVLFAIALLCLLAALVTGWGAEEDAGTVTPLRVPPLLTKADLPPGYYLDECGKLVEQLTKEEHGKDLTFELIREIWRSVSDEELQKLMKLGPLERAEKISWIYINRRIFKTRKEASENVQLGVQSEYGFPPEGSFSGVKIGEKCWSKRGSLGEREPYFRVLVFLKKHQVVTIFLHKYPEADPKLVEKLALIVASRI